MRRPERAGVAPASLSVSAKKAPPPGPAVRAIGAAIAAIFLFGALSAAAGDPARGEQLWRKCASCHTLDANGRNRAGPRLHGIFGRAAGSVPDYSYSEALRKSGIVWDDATLDAYLKDSEAFVPGTKMYGGLSQDADREDLLAFLRSATAR
jgi:cytochrome c